MNDVCTGPADQLPGNAELALTAEHVVRLKGDGTLLVGRIECASLQAGDHVIAMVGDTPVCQGVVSSVERFAETLPVAQRGDSVGVLFRGWGDFTLPVGVRLFWSPRTAGEVVG